MKRSLKVSSKWYGFINAQHSPVESTSPISRRLVLFADECNRLRDALHDVKTDASLLCDR
jgi:hypothetical protein